MLYATLLQAQPIIDTQTGLSIAVVLSLVGGTAAVVRSVTAAAVTTSERLTSINSKLEALKTVPEAVASIRSELHHVRADLDRLEGDVNHLWQQQRGGAPGQRRKTPRKRTRNEGE